MYNSYTNISKNWLDDSNIEKILKIEKFTLQRSYTKLKTGTEIIQPRNTLTKHGFIYIKKNATKCPRQNTDQAEIVADFDRQSAK